MKPKINKYAWYAIAGGIAFFLLTVVAALLCRVWFKHIFLMDPDFPKMHAKAPHLQDDSLNEGWIIITSSVGVGVSFLATLLPILGLFFNKHEHQRGWIFAGELIIMFIAFDIVIVPFTDLLLGSVARGDYLNYRIAAEVISVLALFVGVGLNGVYLGLGNEKEYSEIDKRFADLENKIDKLSKRK